MAQDNQPTRTLLLTGASRGIGHATVKRFGAAGWRVLTVSRHAFSEHCPWDGGKDNHIQLDLSDLKGLPAAIEAIREKLPEGRLDAMVNNAAIIARSNLICRAEKIPMVKLTSRTKAPTAPSANCHSKRSQM